VTERIGNQFDPEWVFNQVLQIQHKLEVLNLILDQASEGKLESVRELKDPSRNDECPHFFAVILQIQAERLTKKLERSW
jgi:hypothetical protein